MSAAIGAAYSVRSRARVARRPRWWILWVPVPVLLALVVGLVGRPDTVTDDRPGTAAYANAITPIQKDGGRLVYEGVRTSVASLFRGELAPADFRARAGAWKADLERVRLQLAAQQPPARLKPAAELFDRALRQYRAAIDGFVTASRAPAARLQAALTAAVPAAERADRTYDRADALVQRELRRLGLPTKPVLP